MHAKAHKYPVFISIQTHITQYKLIINVTSISSHQRKTKQHEHAAARYII